MPRHGPQAHAAHSLDLPRAALAPKGGEESYKRERKRGRARRSATVAAPTTQCLSWREHILAYNSRTQPRRKTGRRATPRAVVISGDAFARRKSLTPK